MEREIKFRAKRVDNNEWVHGDLHLTCLFPHIHTKPIVGSKLSLKFNIDTDTIGQFTGLTDNNGKEIYEGDIVLQKDYHGKKTPMAVKFECGAFIVGYHNGSSTKRRPMLLNSQCEVIGNVFDDSL